MNKKLGIILMFVGAYTTLIGGLVWVMSFPNAQIGTVVKPYDWVWGLLTAVVLVIGTVFAAKGYIFGLIGFGITLLGLIGNIGLLIYGVTQEDFLSVIVLIGTIMVAVGLTIGLVFHILNMRKIAKHGNTLLN